MAPLRKAWLWLPLALCLTTCGDDKPPECQKPAECVGKPDSNACKPVGGHNRCVYECVLVDGKDNCPTSLHCTGTADDGSTYCRPS